MPTIPKPITLQPPDWYKQNWKDKYSIQNKVGCLFNDSSCLYAMVQSNSTNRELNINVGDFDYSYVNASNARFTQHALEQLGKWSIRLREVKQHRSRWMNWRNIRVNENYIDLKVPATCPYNRIVPMFVLMCGFPEFTEHNLLTLYLTAYATANAARLGRNHFAEDFAGIPEFEGRMLMPTHDLFDVLEQHPESIPATYAAVTPVVETDGATLDAMNAFRAQIAAGISNMNESWNVAISEIRSV